MQGTQRKSMLSQYPWLRRSSNTAHPSWIPRTPAMVFDDVCRSRYVNVEGRRLLSNNTISSPTRRRVRRDIGPGRLATHVGGASWAWVRRLAMIHVNRGGEHELRSSMAEKGILDSVADGVFWRERVASQHDVHIYERYGPRSGLMHARSEDVT